MFPTRNLFDLCNSLKLTFWKYKNDLCSKKCNVHLFFSGTNRSLLTQDRTRCPPQIVSSKNLVFGHYLHAFWFIYRNTFSKIFTYVHFYYCTHYSLFLIDILLSAVAAHKSFLNASLNSLFIMLACAFFSAHFSKMVVIYAERIELGYNVLRGNNKNLNLATARELHVNIFKMHAFRMLILVLQTFFAFSDRNFSLANLHCARLLGGFYFSCEELLVFKRNI